MQAKKEREFGALAPLAAALIVWMASSANAARIVSTFDVGGADAEVRESTPTTNLGTSTELAVRADSSRVSKSYVKLPVGSITADELSNPITYRLTFGANNLNSSRISNTTLATPPPYPSAYDGLLYYILDPNNAGANWDESTITYNNAPGGLAADGNFTTKDLDLSAGNLSLLGEKRFREIGYIGAQPQENHLPVGEAMDITFAPGSALHMAILAAQATAHESITLVTTILHDYNGSNQGVLPDYPNNPHGNFNGINYVFNPKEKNPLNNDNGYDNDVAAADGNEGSPYSCSPSGSNLCTNGTTSLGANTAANPFAPQLILVPEPTSLLLLVMGAMCAAAGRRRK